MRAVTTLLFLLAAMPAYAATVTVIDVPGAQYTYAEAISPSGIVGGGYSPSGNDPCGQQCGYLRMPNGTFQTFPIFNAVQWATVTGVLDDGTAVGDYYDGHVYRGFARTPDGGMDDISQDRLSTVMVGINKSGIALGSVFGRRHDETLLRTPDGNVQILTLDGCRLSSGSGINAKGSVAGDCYHNHEHIGFLRLPNGRVKLVKRPSWQEATVGAIDGTGAVAGICTDEATGIGGYVRDTHGTYTTFTLPGTSKVNEHVTAMTVVGGDRQVAGWFVDNDSRDYGFVVHANGTSDVFDISNGHVAGGGTLVTGISPSGAVVGYYFDDNLQPHGYIRTP